MSSGFKNVIWNIRLKGWDYVKKYAGIAAAVSVAAGSAAWGVHSTRCRLESIVAAKALDRERAGAPEYLYYNDPQHEQHIHNILDDDTTDTSWSIWPYMERRVRRWRRAIWRRLLEICCYGEEADRLMAVRHLSALTHLTDWELTWLSQRLEARAAAHVARGGAAVTALLRTPPLPMSVRGMPPSQPLAVLATAAPKHSCLAAYLQSHADRHQEEVQRLIEQEANGSSRRVSGDSDNEDDILLESLSAVLHHFDMTPSIPDQVSPPEVFANAGGLALVQRAASSSDHNLQLIAARVLLCLAPYSQLLPLIHRAGLLKILAQWVQGTDPELGCLAAGALAGLEGSGHEQYGPAVQLLHPVYRPLREPHLDLVTVHGLLGEPFVTWRQRDRLESEADLAELENIDNEDDEIAVNDFEVVLRDLPESALRDPEFTVLSSSVERGFDKREKKELLERSRCWPRDWLPRDCSNIRVLGVRYDTVMTEWGTCAGGGEPGGLEARAKLLEQALRKAGVGTRPTVWVAHSMGGLLVKQILVNSLESEVESEQELAKNTWGVVFYSTPHHGTRAAHALLWPSREVQDLREDCAALGRLHTRWRAGGWRCICFGEGRATPLLTVAGLAPALHLVPPNSADAGVGPFYTLPLDHLDICKPATRNSFIYRKVVEMVQHAKGEKCSAKGCWECKNMGEEDNGLFAAVAGMYRQLNPRKSMESSPDILNSAVNEGQEIATPNVSDETPLTLEKEDQSRLTPQRSWWSRLNPFAARNC